MFDTSALPKDVTETIENIATAAEAHPERLGSSKLQPFGALPQPKPEDIAARSVYLGPKTKKYTLVFDLDETLGLGLDLGDLEGIGEEERLLFQLRPYAVELLHKISQLYELVVFTAADQDYATKALASLDPDKHVSKLVTRAHCLPHPKGGYTKDLRIFVDRRLDEMLIIDNDARNFVYQPKNGIPVVSFDGSPKDDELLFLIHYLEELYEATDIVETNYARMQLNFT
jgi:TFIIF-interacting CTD phosphatase-like protein